MASSGTVANGAAFASHLASQVNIPNIFSPLRILQICLIQYFKKLI